MKAEGIFVVQLKPLDPYAKGGHGVSIGRMSIDKEFRGDLEGVSKGEMLSAMTSTVDSASYVAIEHVEGQLMGKKGSFALSHFGKMQAGSQQLILEVVPDSGTGELKGLSGEMSILIEAGKHHYQFEFEWGK